MHKNNNKRGGLPETLINPLVPALDAIREVDKLETGLNAVPTKLTMKPIKAFSLNHSAQNH